MRARGVFRAQGVFRTRSALRTRRILHKKRIAQEAHCAQGHLIAYHLQQAYYFTLDSAIYFLYSLTTSCYPSCFRRCDMIMLYFSGTGNSKYIAELFCAKMNVECHSIEEHTDFEQLLAASETIAFCYPVYMSRVPRIMREFVLAHMDSLKDKKLIIFCTQMILSGDGARAFAALFPSGYIKIAYAEHFFMPNNVSSAALVPMASDKLAKTYLRRAERRMETVCRDINAGTVKKRGFSVGSRALGLLQSPLMSPIERKANSSVRVSGACTLCGVCVSVCPMSNLVCENGSITHRHNCTMCYRCINKCPKKAITIVFHSKVKKQYIFPAPKSSD